MFKRSFYLATVATLAMRGPARAGAIDGVVDNLDNVPEALHSEYVKQGDKFVLQVTGFRPETEFTRVQGALNKERTDRTALENRVKTAFGEEKLEDVRAKLDRIPELEAAAEGKLDDAKINNIVEGRVKTRLAPIERERDDLKNENGTLKQEIDGYKGKDRTRSIHDKAREAGTAAKMLPEAMEDFLLLADRIFEVREDDGKVVVKDNVGFTPGIEPTVLISDLQSKRPHWWGPSSGGGSGGNRDGNKGVDNPFTYANWNMTKQGQLMNSDPAKAEQLAKAAGHKDAATAVKPAAPK